MMTNCGLCQDCKYWEGASENSEDEWGFCDMTHTKSQIEDADHAPSHPETKAKAVEEYYSGCLQTCSDFGCVQFEQKRLRGGLGENYNVKSGGASSLRDM